MDDDMMKLALTAVQLHKAGACHEVVEAFVAVFGESAEVEWTREKQVEVMRGPFGRHVGWACQKGLIPLWSLARIDLTGADLSGAFLSGAYLNLSGLARANLARANLSDANLSGASLAGANLSGANLTGARLVGATLAGARLVGATLNGASLDSACLDGAVLDAAYLSGTNLANAGLFGVSISHAWHLNRASLDGAKVCLCSNGHCVGLRDVLAKAGWVAVANGPLGRVPEPDAT